MFTISKMGTREGVIKAIEAAEVAKESSDLSASEAQLKSAKAMLISEVKGLPNEVNGCRLDATGDAHKSGRSLTFSIHPLNLHL